MTIKNYIDYLNLPEGTPEEVCVSTLVGFNINKLKNKEATKLIADMRAWFNKEHREFKQTFIHDGVEYGFIPNLDDDLTYGENQDLCKYISDDKELNRAMAVAYRPIVKKQGSKYLIEDYEGSSKYAQIMLDVDIDIALGMKVFFWTLTNELQSYILRYTTYQEK